MIVKHMSKTAIILILFSLVGTSLLAFTYEATYKKIAENERLTLLNNLHELVPPHLHDNILDTDKLEIVDKRFFGHNKKVIVYRARKEQNPVALVLHNIAPDGYNGKIGFLVGINYDETISGVRVISHKETPGLGDAIELEKSKWIHIFDRTSIEEPEESNWKVSRDRGKFDQITSATITSRAMVKAVKNCLLYVKQHKSELFEKKQ